MVELEHGQLHEFVAALTSLLGSKNVSTNLDDRAKASADWAKMSPILDTMLPLGLADVVAYPASADAIRPVSADAQAIAMIRFMSFP